MDSEKYKTLESVALKLGCDNAKIIPTGNITVEERVQFKCISCPFYGKKLKCPPYAPVPAKFIKILNEYKYALIVNLKPPKCLTTSKMNSK